MKQLNRVIIFGATSCIAEHVARELVAEGASVFCVGRNIAKLESLIKDLGVRACNSERVNGCSADMRNTNMHARTFDHALHSLGGVDAVLIAYGSLPDQQCCESDVELTREEIETNAVSVVSLLTLLANHFAQQGSGVIAVISSVAGDRGRQSNYVYGAAKGMVTLFLQGLRNRLAKSNVAVVTIKPGFVDTPMTSDLDKSGALWAHPQDVAKGIIKAMKKRKDEVYLPHFWWVIMMVIKHIPERIFKKMSL